MKEKEFYKRAIARLVAKINNPNILHCIYVFVSDIAKEDKQ